MNPRKRLLALLLLACCSSEQRSVESITQGSTLQAVSAPASTGASLSPPKNKPGPLELLYRREQHTPQRQYTVNVAESIRAQLIKDVYPKAKVDSKPCTEGGEPGSWNRPVWEAPHVNPLYWYTAEGSFTEPNTRQTLYLIDSRECGHEPGTTVVAIYTGKKLVGRYVSSEYRWISRILDINQDGLSEILFYDQSSQDSVTMVGLFGLPDKSPKIEVAHEKEGPSNYLPTQLSAGDSMFQCWSSFLTYSHKEPIYGLPTNDSGPMKAPRAETYDASIYYHPFTAGELLTFVVK